MAIVIIMTSNVRRCLMKWVGYIAFFWWSPFHRRYQYAIFRSGRICVSCAPPSTHDPLRCAGLCFPACRSVLPMSDLLATRKLRGAPIDGDPGYLVHDRIPPHQILERRFHRLSLLRIPATSRRFVSYNPLNFRPFFAKPFAESRRFGWP